MIEIKPMDESYILVDCLHHGPVDPSSSPRRVENEWQDAPDLPPHPWSDETIAQLAKEYKGISHGWAGDPGREFMREMILRYGTCAILVWEGQKGIGHLRVYPMSVSRLLKQTDPSPVLDSTLACKLEEDEGTLWVQCVMTCPPYEDSEGATQAGARKGIGLKLVRALIPWAKEQGWKRIVKVAHCDLDWFYGIQGGGGKGFWEKAGFKIVGTFYKQAWEFDGNHKSVVQAQMTEKGMTEEDIWTWYLMAYDL